MRLVLDLREDLAVRRTRDALALQPRDVLEGQHAAARARDEDVALLEQDVVLIALLVRGDHRHALGHRVVRDNVPALGDKVLVHLTADISKPLDSGLGRLPLFLLRECEERAERRPRRRDGDHVLVRHHALRDGTVAHLGVQRNAPLAEVPQVSARGEHVRPDEQFVHVVAQHDCKCIEQLRARRALDAGGRGEDLLVQHVDNSLAAAEAEARRAVLLRHSEREFASIRLGVLNSFVLHADGAHADPPGRRPILAERVNREENSAYARDSRVANNLPSARHAGIDGVLIVGFRHLRRAPLDHESGASKSLPSHSVLQSSAATQ